MQNLIKKNCVGRAAYNGGEQIGERIGQRPRIGERSPKFSLIPRSPVAMVRRADPLATGIG